jgi:hypothetical protein
MLPTHSESLGSVGSGPSVGSVSIRSNSKEWYLLCCDHCIPLRELISVMMDRFPRSWRSRSSALLLFASVLLCLAINLTSSLVCSWHIPPSIAVCIGEALSSPFSRVVQFFVLVVALCFQLYHRYIVSSCRIPLRISVFFSLGI